MGGFNSKFAPPLANVIMGYVNSANNHLVMSMYNIVQIALTLTREVFSLIRPCVKILVPSSLRDRVQCDKEIESKGGGSIL